MPRIERFMVQTYNRDAGGELIANEAQRYDSPTAAEERAEVVADRHAGVVAYAWIGDMHNSEIGKISLLTKRGDVPFYAALALGIEEAAA